MCLDLGELEFAVLRVHATDLIVGRRAQHLDDLNELIHSTVAGEDGLTQQQLCEHAARRPDV